jgi:hypothetical protein
MKIGFGQHIHVMPHLRPDEKMRNHRIEQGALHFPRPIALTWRCRISCSGRSLQSFRFQRAAFKFGDNFFCFRGIGRKQAHNNRYGVLWKNSCPPVRQSARRDRSFPVSKQKDFSLASSAASAFSFFRRVGEFVVMFHIVDGLKHADSLDFLRGQRPRPLHTETITSGSLEKNRLPWVPATAFFFFFRLRFWPCGGRHGFS